MFASQSIALVGASPREGSLGRTALRKMREAVFESQIHLANPKRHEIDEIATVESLEALPRAPDLVVIRKRRLPPYTASTRTRISPTLGSV
jgi:acetyltransferase